MTPSSYKNISKVVQTRKSPWGHHWMDAFHWSRITAVHWLLGHLWCLREDQANMGGCRFCILGLWCEDIRRSWPLQRNWILYSFTYGSSAACAWLQNMFSSSHLDGFSSVRFLMRYVQTFSCACAPVFPTRRLKRGGIMICAPPCSLMGPACSSVHRRNKLNPRGNERNFKTRLSNRIWESFEPWIKAGYELL